MLVIAILLQITYINRKKIKFGTNVKEIIGERWMLQTTLIILMKKSK
jgi:hypothetical protein